MAFVCRTTRDSNRVGERKDATGPNIGPGSYNNTGPQRSFRSHPPSYVPFGSTAERVAPEVTQLVTPAPGTYKPAEERVKPAAASDTFKSKAPRMEPVRGRDGPGPGAYPAPKGMAAEAAARAAASANVGSTSNYGNAQGRGSAAAVKWVRVPTAPSIPVVSQSFGFDEGPNGELIMQRPVNVGHTGRKGDTVGPGDYDPSISATRARARASDFSRTRSARVAPSLAGGAAGEGAAGAGLGGVGGTGVGGGGGPGPGSYNFDPGQGSSGVAPPSMMAVQKSSVFQSGTSRAKPLPSMRQDPTPGPGSYTAPSDFNVATKEEHLQFFGSTSQRLGRGPRDAARRFGGPGPGAYRNAAPSSFTFKTSRKLAPPDHANVGFSSTASRFRRSAKATAQQALAGPGSYSLPTMAGDLQKKLVGRTGVFGSSTKRFHQSRADAAPGPGWYEAEDGGVAGGAGAGGAGGAAPSVSSPTRSKPTATFASREPRCPEHHVADVPPPGAYDITQSWKKGSGVGLISSGEARFRASKATAAVPGPGRYSHKSSLKPTAPNRKGVMIGGETRFHAPRAAAQPGPGTYDPEFLFGNLNKPTFNMSIADGQF